MSTMFAPNITLITGNRSNASDSCLHKVFGLQRDIQNSLSSDKCFNVLRCNRYSPQDAIFSLQKLGFRGIVCEKIKQKPMGLTQATEPN